jgi:uncharacterized membrane protein
MAFYQGYCSLANIPKQLIFSIYMRIVKKLFYIIAWVFIVGLSLYFFYDNVIAFFYGYESPSMGKTFFNNQLWLVMHIVGGTITLFLGPLQFWSFIRNRFMNFHRTAGKIYMAGIALIGISAGRLSFISYCVPCRLSLFLLTIFAVLSTFFAWKAIKSRNIKVHRQMMIRSYVCVMAFVAVRLDWIVSLDFLFGVTEDDLMRRVLNEYFFSFVPLLITEIIISWWPSVAYSFKTKAK